MDHSPEFTKIADDARSRIKELTIQQVRSMLDDFEIFHFIDVREESEWVKGQLPRAVHISKGIIERDIKKKIPDTSDKIILYCGGGYRSALAADNLQKMGYTDLYSMDGGYRAWKEAGYEIVNEDSE